MGCVAQASELCKEDDLKPGSVKRACGQGTLDAPSVLSRVRWNEGAQDGGARPPPQWGQKVRAPPTRGPGFMSRLVPRCLRD